MLVWGQWVADALRHTHPHMLLDSHLSSPPPPPPPPPPSPAQDPCLTLVLRDVICPTCQDCQDLDLCRDPAVGGCARWWWWEGGVSGKKHAMWNGWGR